ncbi:MAG: GTP-binding protein [Dehalococcoidia bacterium]|nr:GTP-binding protein [Dehalococcoidia bacterium]
MIQKKICMLGSFAVGKTSLVRRYIENMFSDKYLTTIGVKIDKKVINLLGENVTLMIWDIAGEDGYHQLQSSYLRGMSGYFLVVDKTRMSTLNAVIDIQKKIMGTFKDIPNIVIINKTDLAGQWDICDSAIEDLQRKGQDILMTSAKTGENVEQAFSRLSSKMLGK